MLRHTFLHFPGIGEKKEKSLWERGILTWDDFERQFLPQRGLFPTEAEDALLRAIEQSRVALEHGDFDFFAERLPKSEHYRIALAEPDATVFVDIEATGLSLYYDHITLIGAADSERYYLYTKGQDIAPLERAVAKAKCIVTFNGTLYDIKFLQKEFPQLRFPKAHIDLRFCGLPYGLRGTQKLIEKKLGLKRPQDIQTMRGEKAPLLWYRYIRGDLESGKQLVEYNHSDVEGMKFIFDAIIDRAIKANPIISKLARVPRFFENGRAVRWATKPNTNANLVYLPPYAGKVGPQITYRDLITDERSAKLRVVGIDLTGSEKRPTGWCLLSGNEAVTKLIRTDKELIDETLAARPDIVSIDSPLSLPRGRKRVTNDDPGREKFGIMRECERTLKKRGVNVYPSLIDSMQKLTARGIRLARKLRSLGVPVIESYPGAAQDIMGIPRKRLSLEYLKEGLGAFGVKGSFLTTPVSHDEVDAVTSAVVGVFFWSGKFEALGNEDEEYLIIPDLLVPPDPWRQRMAIGISGPIASGKTTAAQFLERTEGFAYGRYSQVLAEQLKAKGLPVTRTTLQKIGDAIHRKPGQRWLSRQLIAGLPRDRNLAIDGLRFPEDHAYMVEAFGPAFFHVHVTATEKTRMKRYIKGGNTTQSFKKAIRHHVEAAIPRLESIAHMHVVNEGSKRAYEAEIENLASKLRFEKPTNTRKIA